MNYQNQQDDICAIEQMNEQEKIAHIQELTDAIHSCYEEMENVLRDVAKSVERMIDHNMNADLVKVEGG